MRKNSALALCLAAAAMAQQQTDEKPASIEGVVTNALTGAPILRAHVTCSGAGKPQPFGAITDAEGKFSIKGLPAANYYLNVERIGFVPSNRNGRRGASVTLKPGDAKSDVRLELTPTGAILGRVVDHDGNPLEGVRVSAEPVGTMYSAGTMGFTDEKGQYRIGGLDPGRYRVRAVISSLLPLPPEIRTDGHEDPRHVSTYHPNAMDAKSATRLDVRSGADLTGIDIRMQRAPDVRVSGIVTGMPDGPSNNVYVETRNANMSGRPAAVGPDGRFEIWNLDPGKWVLAAQTSSRTGAAARSAGVEIEVGMQHIDNLELRLMEPFDVTGQAVFEDDAAKPKPVNPNGPPPRMALQEVSRLGGSRGTPPLVLPDDGTFKFPNVAPGRYRVNYGWRASIRSVRLGAVEMQDGILDLSNGTGGAPVTVTFSSALGEVAGTVRDEKGPAPGVRVVMRNPSVSVTSTNGLYNTVTAADGTYRFTSIPMGKYILAALDEGDTGMRDTLDDYGDAALEIEIRGADRKTHDLRRRPPGGR